MDLNKARLHRFTDFESDRDEASVGATRRIDVFHAIQPPDSALDRFRNFSFHFGGFKPGSRRLNIDHRNRDLRFLFFGCEIDGKQSHQNA